MATRASIQFTTLAARSVSRTLSNPRSRRRGLAQSNIKTIRENIVGNHAFDPRLQGCGTHHQTPAERQPDQRARSTSK